MALDSYAGLQAAVLDWLARPGDLLVAPFIPDMIVLAESELRRRLRVGEAEQRASLTATTAAVALPAGCRQIRLVTSDGALVTYVPPDQLPGGSGPPYHYTLHGTELRLGPAPSGSVTLEVLYQSGLPALSDAAPANWLLADHPDAYLYSTLVAAEAFIGHDERIALWTQAAASVLASIEQADRKARWPGGLTIKVDGITATGGMSGVGGTSGAWTITPASAGTAATVYTPPDGTAVALSTGLSYIDTPPLSLLTVRLPATGLVAEIGFLSPVSSLTVQDATGAVIATAPTSAYGPGAALVFRKIDGLGWVYSK